MIPSSEKQQINRFLGQHGLGQLDDPGVIPQLAFLIEDHVHFRQLLRRCEPMLRNQMYNGLRSYLRFEPKPLDVYESEMKMEADAKRLPTVDEEGKLIAYEDYIPGGKVNPLHRLAEKAIHDAEALKAAGGHRLKVSCAKCTAEAEFVGATLVSATMEARMAGWVYQELDGKGVEICPKCPAMRKAIAGNA